jgi:hypothetical protein
MSLSIAWLIIKTAFSRIAAFTIAHWRIVLPVAIVVATLWCIHSLRVERDEWRTAYESYIQSIKQQAETRKLENERKEQKVNLEINSVMANHAAQINQLRSEDEKKLKDQQRSADGSIALWRERVRLELAKSTDGLSSLQEAASGSAESGGDGNAAAIRKAYDTLELACAVTTSDYNALAESWAKTCQIYGCR